MSNIYIQEPPTSGKVLLKTSVGDIDVELWAKETPKASRNFIQLCIEGYYNGTIFHRVVKDFIVQGGDPKGDGTGGESIYGGTFKDEFHSRLRFARRGLVAMANAGKDDNGSQFFFTMAATPELQNKHTIFGKVSGETIYNMLKLEDGMVDIDERPQYPHKILKTEVLNNPFTDIIPRTIAVVEKEKPRNEKREKKAGVKNFKLLSFGEEAEGDEEEATVANKKLNPKGKSSHDVLDDPKLSSVPAVSTGETSKRPNESNEDTSSLSGDEPSEHITRLKLLSHDIRKKLKKTEHDIEDSSEEEKGYVFGEDRRNERRKLTEDVRGEINNLKKNLQNDKKSKDTKLKEQKVQEEKKIMKSSIIHEFHEEKNKYKNLRKDIPKTGPSREEFTLNLLAQFHQKLEAAKQRNQTAEETPVDKPDKNKKQRREEKEEGEDDSDEDGDDWLAHKLEFEEKGATVAKDASTKTDDWFEIYDPRNPLNKRRREESKKILQTRR